MKNKVIIVVSSVLLIIVLSLIIVISLSDKTPTENELNNQYTVDEQSPISDYNHIDDLIINNGNLDSSDNVEFIKDLGKIPENKIFAYRVQTTDELNVSDMYSDYIYSITGTRVDTYWVECIDDVTEKVYWYSSDGVLQSETLTY